MNDNPQVPVLAPSRLPVSPQIAKEFDLNPAQWRVLVDQIFPSAKTIEAVMMALTYCRARNLDIFKRPVHIVPMWSSAKKAMVETVWPGIAEIRTTAARTGEYAGIDAVEFGPMIDRKFIATIDAWENGRKNGTREEEKTVSFPEWASVVVYRYVKGKRSAFHTKIYWEETYGRSGKSDIPNDMWCKRPRGQIDKCLEAAALRKAFPEEVGNMLEAEEREGQIIVSDHDIKPAKEISGPPPAPTEEQEVPEEQEAEVDAEVDFNPTDFLAEIEETLERANTPEELNQFWFELDVEATLTAHEDDLKIAVAIKGRLLNCFPSGDPEQ